MIFKSNNRFDFMVIKIFYFSVARETRASNFTQSMELTPKSMVLEPCILALYKTN